MNSEWVSQIKDVSAYLSTERGAWSFGRIGIRNLPVGSLPRYLILSSFVPYAWTMNINRCRDMTCRVPTSINLELKDYI